MNSERCALVEEVATRCGGEKLARVGWVFRSHHSCVLFNLICIVLKCPGKSFYLNLQQSCENILNLALEDNQLRQQMRATRKTGAFKTQSNAIVMGGQSVVCLRTNGVGSEAQPYLHLLLHCDQTVLQNKNPALTNKRKKRTSPKTDTSPSLVLMIPDRPCVKLYQREARQPKNKPADRNYEDTITCIPIGSMLKLKANAN